MESSTIISPKKEVTRYGPVKDIDPKFGSEKRFAPSSSQMSSDVMYNLPDVRMTRSVIFGSSLRNTSDENPDAKTRSNGPGSYDISRCYDHLSEYGTKIGNKFACAPRQSMAMKTPSPGAVYDIDQTFYLGKDKGQKIGFPNASRLPMFNNSTSSNADMFFPKSDPGRAVSIAKRLKRKDTISYTPGAIYDVEVSLFTK
jgi:hypothetical protein